MFYCRTSVAPVFSEKCHDKTNVFFLFLVHATKAQVFLRQKIVSSRISNELAIE